jgi:type IV pilus assembly protein PilW
MNSLIPSNSYSRGFTLLELIIAMAIFGTASAAIYATYQNQQDSYLIQEQVADMQQNLRAGMYFITRGLKMAGYDPTGKAGAGANTANSAGKAEFICAADEDRDGTIAAAEIIRYALTKDTNKDGLADSFPCNLGRADGGGGLQPLAENIQGLEFFYHLADGTTSAQPANFSDVRSVDVSLLVRTQYTIKGHTDTMQYFPASNSNHESGAGKSVWGPFNDGYRRKLLITNVQCRNLGLQ